MKQFIRDKIEIILALTLLAICVVGMAATQETKAGEATKTLRTYENNWYIRKEYQITPHKAEGLQVTQASPDAMTISWQPVLCVDGYQVYMSTSGEENLALVGELTAEQETAYSATGLSPNTVCFYQVYAYTNMDGEMILGEATDIIKHQTPLNPSALTSVKKQSYNSIQLEWQFIDGAVGYQIYRSTASDGEYVSIAEIADGSVTTYTDTTCECGVTYFYYIAACQATDAGKVYGIPSAVQSAQTVPNYVGLSGSKSSNDTQVNLRWKQAAGAQGYEIYRSIGDTSNYSLIKKIEKGDTLSWSNTGLEKDTVYFYRIRPYCVVNGNTVYGSYSNAYEKEVVIVYNYSSATGVDVLKQYVGRSYVFGGTSATKGWDCSGFTQYAFAKHFGVSLPRTAAEQAGRGQSVSKNDRSSWKPGDLLFYKENGRISHVAVYLGDGQMIHALSSKYDTLIQGVDYYEKWDNKTSLYCVRRYF